MLFLPGHQTAKKANLPHRSFMVFIAAMIQLWGPSILETHPLFLLVLALQYVLQPQYYTLIVHFENHSKWASSQLFNRKINSLDCWWQIFVTSKQVFFKNKYCNKENGKIKHKLAIKCNSLPSIGWTPEILSIIFKKRTSPHPICISLTKVSLLLKCFINIDSFWMPLCFSISFKIKIQNFENIYDLLKYSDLQILKYLWP